MFLSACTTANIVHNTQESTLSLQMDDVTITKAYGKLLYQNRVNLSNINVYQSVYATSQGIMTYEDVQVSSGYKFSKGINVIIHNVFKSYSYKQVDNIGNTFFFELKSKNNKANLYLIVENKNKKALNLVYGMNKETFLKLIKAVNEKQPVKKTSKSITEPVANDKSTYIKSEWNYNNIILDNLISKVGSGRKAKM